MRRWTGQRWALDNVLRSVGIDWDQPRSFYLNAACGIEGGADFAAIRERVRKYADIEPAFANTARRREAKARAAEEDGSPVTARDNYFMAAIHWGSAQWSHYENDATNLAYNKSKRDCYTRYAALADHKIEPVMIPFKGKSLPGWFHLPPNYQGGRIPVVISFPGMDTYKEVFVALKATAGSSAASRCWRSTGRARPNAACSGLTVSMENWTAVGKAAVDWLVARPEIDPQKIGAFGNSFGSFFVTIVTANEPRICACVANSNNLEPGFHAIFEEASPSYKKRFMYMAGFTDEAQVRRLPQDADLGGPCRENPRAVSLRHRRMGRAQPDGAHRADALAHEQPAPPRGLSGCPPRHRRLPVGQSRAASADHGGRLDGGALCRQADGERALVCRQQRRGDEDGAVRR